MDLRHVEHIYNASCIRPISICVRKPTLPHRRELGFSTRSFWQRQRSSEAVVSMACHPMLHLVQVLESAPDALKKAWKSGHLDAVNAWVKEAPRALSVSM